MKIFTIKVNLVMTNLMVKDIYYNMEKINYYI